MSRLTIVPTPAVPTQARRRVPATPAYDHAVWCTAHDDGGRWSQNCMTVPVTLDPAAGSHVEPMTVSVTLDQVQHRDGDATGWEVDPAAVVLAVAAGRGPDGRPEWTEAVLTPAEARRVAAELVAFAERAESETWRCQR